MLFDTHTHSNVSDGENSPEEMFSKAVKLNMDFLALTDHVEMVYCGTEDEQEVIIYSRTAEDEAYKSLIDLKSSVNSNYANKTKLLIGVEIGQAHMKPYEADKLLSSRDYDYVIGSCHAIRGYKDFYHLDYSKCDRDVLLKQYFEELIELCEWSSTYKKFDSLAHLTYPLRYMNANSEKASLDKHRKALDKLFEVLIKYEIALEINTQRVGTSYNRLSPELSEVARYRKLGGKLIIIGSDAHNVNALMNGFPVAEDTAKRAGFKEIVYYEGRTMKFIKL